MRTFYRPIVQLIFLFGLLTVSSLHAQNGFETTLVDAASVLAGPGHTYERLGILNMDTAVIITERNRVGHWLRIEADDLDGWVRIGNVDTTNLLLSDIPVNMDLPDADVSAITDEREVRLYSVPIIPEISPAMGEIYGSIFNNNATDVVVKVGDSNSANSTYLTPISENNYTLEPYDMLTNSVDHFAENMGTNEIAARVGLNGFSLFDTFWSPIDTCEQDETPLMCEYRVSRPTIAVIMFGPNDLRVLNSTEYTEQMTLIIEETLAQGVIPILSTFSSDPDEDTWDQALRFNTILVDLAEAFEIPLVNLWSAAQALPNAGIGEDNVHMTISGGSLDLSQGHESRLGVPLQNLIVLNTIDAIYEAIIADSG